MDIFNHPQFYKRLLLLNSIMTFGSICNAVFILISGYFIANRKAEDIGIGNIAKKLLLQLVFAATLLTCCTPILHEVKPEIFSVMPSISIINSMSWFVGYYFIVVLCGVLFLNKFLENLEIKRYTSFLITLLAVIQFSFSLEILDDLAGAGLSTVMTGIFLYSLGGFIKRFDPFKNVRLYVFFLVIIAVYAVIWISAYNETQTNIEEYIRSGRTDPFIQNLSSYSNFSIVTIIISVCMFEVFRRIRLPENNFVSFLGKSTLMIYLIHDNAFFYQIWNLRDWITTLGTSPGLFLLNIFKWAGYTFAAGVCAYIAFVGLKWLFSKGRKLFTKISD